MLVHVYQTAQRRAVQVNNVYFLPPVQKMLKKVKFQVLKTGGYLRVK